MSSASGRRVEMEPTTAAPQASAPAIFHACYHSLRHSMQCSRRKGMTLLEVMVAVTVTVLIIGGATVAFIQLLRSNDRAQARVEATANARTAIDALTVELKRAQTTGTLTARFVGNTESSGSLTDAIDQDNDGKIDEELLNGFDDDGDWQLADDRHAIIDTSGTRYVERPVYYQHPDLDDWHIDVDIKQSSASVEFSTFATPGETDPRSVRFYLGLDPDGEPNTLMKQVTSFDPATSAMVTVAGPVAHNVYSFGLLFWDEASAHDPNSNPWRTSWDDTMSTSTFAPASVYMTISVYAGTPLKLNEVPPGDQIPTVTLTSVVDIEAVLASPEFRAIKLLYGDIQPLP
ncbi:MAG: PilW family protein [Candidatus Sumerlaeaceae bacterium]